VEAMGKGLEELAFCPPSRGRTGQLTCESASHCFGSGDGFGQFHCDFQKEPEGRVSFCRGLAAHERSFPSIKHG
jgi:hypothetical protein